VAKQDNWTTDIVVSGIGVALGFASSMGMSRVSVGSFEATKAVLELIAVFVAMHYMRRFAQTVPLIGKVAGVAFCAVQLMAAYVISAGLAINYFPG